MSFLHYSSHKAKRVTRSVLGAEAYALADAFDWAYTARKDLERMLGRDIPISLYTDSKSLFDVIARSSITTERRLMIDLAAARQAYAEMEINDLALLRSEDNPADALTKVCQCEALAEFIATSTYTRRVEQWVIRQPPEEE